MAILRKPRINKKRASLRRSLKKDFDLIKHIREMRYGRVIGWPRSEILQEKILEYVPKDVTLYESLEWIKQLEMALTQRKTQAFPVGSRRGKWLLETLKDLGFSVETGLSADKNWVIVHSIFLPKKTQSQTLPGQF